MRNIRKQELVDYVAVTEGPASIGVSVRFQDLPVYHELLPEEELLFLGNCAKNALAKTVLDNTRIKLANGDTLVLTHRFLTGYEDHVFVDISVLRMPRRKLPGDKLIPLIALSISAIGVIVTIATAIRHWYGG